MLPPEPLLVVLTKVRKEPNWSNTWIITQFCNDQVTLTRTVHLQPGVPPVRHHDVVEAVHGEAGGAVELAVTLAAGAERIQKLAVTSEHLQGKGRMKPLERSSII